MSELNPNKNTKKESDSLKQDEEKLKKEPMTPKLSKLQQDRLASNIQKITRAKDQRNEAREEFDDMTYEQDYFYNKRAKNAYLPKKANDDETRVNTGTIEQKVEVLMNELLSMNLQPEGNVFDDDDNEVKNLGGDFIDIVKRTNQIEKDEDFWVDFVMELITQRAVFVQEADTVQKYFSTTIRRAEKKLWSGLRVYLGDVNIPARMFQTQPYICLYTRRSYDEAKTIYGEWERWKYVTAGSFNGSSENPIGYRMNNLNDQEIEEIHIINPITNEYDILINGVPMMVDPVKLPWMVIPGRAYNMGMFTIKSLDTDFAYGKQPVASAKFMQGLKDETIRLMIRKMQQAIEPPIGVKKGNVYSKDIWSPGSVAQGVGKDDFSKLIDHDGVTNSEFNMLELIETETEKFLATGTLGGVSPSGEQTATESQQLQRNSIKNLGLIVLAVMRAKRDMSFLRIYNIIENFVQPKRRSLDSLSNQLSNVFNKFTINNVILDNGKKGKKVIQFTDSPLTEEEKGNIFSFEEREEALGRPIRIRAINVKLLKQLQLFWFVTVTSQPIEGSQLSKVLYKDKLAQGVGIEEASKGQKKINWDKAAEDFEGTWETKDFFQKEAPQQLGQGQQPQPEEGQGEDLLKQIEGFERSQAGSEMTEGSRRQNQKPSINRIEDNVQ